MAHRASTHGPKAAGDILPLLNKKAQGRRNPEKPVMSTPTLQTTVVGSYPIPGWLAALPSTPNLRDAILVVLKTQELAGIDVVTDGELSRFDVNHPETNGMIEYFVRPMDGIRTALGR